MKNFLIICKIVLKRTKKVILYNKNLKRMSKHFYLIIGTSILF